MEKLFLALLTLSISNLALAECVVYVPGKSNYKADRQVARFLKLKGYVIHDDPATKADAFFAYIGQITWIPEEMGNQYEGVLPNTGKYTALPMTKIAYGSDVKTFTGRLSPKLILASLKYMGCNP